jgi:cell filamentation protein
VTFDPFGDFATRGYLRNLARAKDPDIVRRLQHNSFMTGLDEALTKLAEQKRLSYSDVLGTHKILFEAVFPWAGEDRLTNAPHLAVSKGPVLFAYPQDIRRSIDYALEHGQDKAFMASRPGEVMGYLAYGHPFLEGNGRTIMVVHSVLAGRADLSIDWAATGKDEYLSALTREIDRPGKGELYAYLKPFIRRAAAKDAIAVNVAAAPGLDGNADNAVLGNIRDPALRTRYEAQEMKRKQAKES